MVVDAATIRQRQVPSNRGGESGPVGTSETSDLMETSLHSAPPDTLPEDSGASVAEALPPRVVGHLGSGKTGPTLICLGSIHGNEPAGYLGLQRVVAQLQAAETPFVGEMVALVGNRTALAKRCRWVDEDLNRIWHTERLFELRDGASPESVEEEELLDLADVIANAATQARHGVWLLDLHTTSGEGPPFGVLDDTLPNREFASLFRLPFVVGLEERLDGTLLGFYVSRGVRTFGLECGQHDDPDSPGRAEAAIWIALAGLGLIEESAVPDLEGSRKRLTRETRGLPSVVEIRYRHPIEEADQFRMEPGYVSFQRIQKGQVFSLDASGPVAAPEKGRLLMPLYQKQGNDGFFVVRRISRLWMGLSAWLRRLRAERYLRWFPGVSAVPGDGDSFIVDRTVARWFAVELLHLLGFRRHGHSGRYLVVSRRPNNATEPVHPRRS